MTDRVHDTRPGLHLLEAILDLDDAEIQRLRTVTDPAAMVDALASTCLWLGVAAYGDLPTFRAVLAELALDFDLDPPHQGEDSSNE